MEIKDVTNTDFQKEVLDSTELVIVDFNANWCGPCRMLRPTLDEIAEESKSCKIVSVNVDNNEELAEKYNVSSIPCLVFIKDGKEVNRSIGLKTKEELEELIGGK